MRRTNTNDLTQLWYIEKHKQKVVLNGVKPLALIINLRLLSNGRNGDRKEEAIESDIRKQNVTGT